MNKKFQELNDRMNRIEDKDIRLSLTVIKDKLILMDLAFDKNFETLFEGANVLIKRLGDLEEKLKTPTILSDLEKIEERYKKLGERAQRYLKILKECDDLLSKTKVNMRLTELRTLRDDWDRIRHLMFKEHRKMKKAYDSYSKKS